MSDYPPIRYLEAWSEYEARVERMRLAERVRRRLGQVRRMREEGIPQGNSASKETE